MTTATTAPRHSSRSRRRDPVSALEAVSALAGTGPATFQDAGPHLLTLMQSLASSPTPLPAAAQAATYLAARDPGMVLDAPADGGTLRQTRPPEYDYPGHTKVRHALAGRADLHPDLAAALALDRYEHVLLAIATNTAVPEPDQVTAAASLRSPRSLTTAARHGSLPVLTRLAALAARKPRCTGRRFDAFRNNDRPADATRWEQTLAELVANRAVTGELYTQVIAACMAHLDADYAAARKEYSNAYAGRDSIVWEPLIERLTDDPTLREQLALGSGNPWLLHDTARSAGASPQVMRAALNDALKALTASPDRTVAPPRADLLADAITYTRALEAHLAGTPAPAIPTTRTHMATPHTMVPAPHVLADLDPTEVSELRRVLDLAVAAAHRWKVDQHRPLREALTPPPEQVLSLSQIDTLFVTGAEADLLDHLDAAATSSAQPHPSMDATRACLARPEISTATALRVANVYFRHQVMTAIHERAFDRQFRIRALAGAPGKQNEVHDIDELLELIPLWVGMRDQRDIVSTATLTRVGHRLLELPWSIVATYLPDVPEVHEHASALLATALTTPAAAGMLANLSHNPELSLLDLIDALAIIAA